MKYKITLQLDDHTFDHVIYVLNNEQLGEIITYCLDNNYKVLKIEKGEKI